MTRFHLLAAAAAVALALPIPALAAPNGDAAFDAFRNCARTPATTTRR